MKVKVCIEETYVQEFEEDVPNGIDPYSYIAEQYHSCNIVLDSGECQFRQMQIHFLDNDSWSGWQEF